MFDDLPVRFRPSAEVRRRFGDAALLRLGAALWRRDPPADRVAASLADGPHGAGVDQLYRALAEAQNAELPPPLVELLEAASAVPPWVDWASVERGGAVFLRAGIVAGVVLGMGSLMRGYASPGGNKPLVFSGRLQQQAARRLAETTRFVQAVSRPGGMRVGSEGFLMTLKVRIIHAQIRRFIDRTGRWMPDSWGEPINQHDMLATTLLFGVAAVSGLRQLGYEVSAAEAEDVVHLWRFVGHIIGVEAQLLPATHAEALEFATAIQETQGPPDDDSRALVAALFQARAAATSPPERRFVAWRLGAMQAIARTLLGDELADQLALPRSHWRQLGAPIRRALGLAARANRLPLWRDVATRLGDRYWDAVVAAAPA